MAKKTSLGKTLIRDHGKFNRKIKDKTAPNSRHTVNPVEKDWSRLNLRSVTEQNSLEEFLATAELANAEFTAEKLNTTIVESHRTGVLTKQENCTISESQKQCREQLRIPRRPQWDKHTSPDELDQKEKESFLQWRRHMAQLEEKENIILTPFERNLEFWRQLWRVIEMSDIIIQIVDARNPLLFYCEDLDRYTKECDEEKLCVLLINKSDFLTKMQRKAWLSYFNSCNMRCVFFTALEDNVEAIGNCTEDSEIQLKSGSTFKESSNICEEEDCKVYTRKELLGYLSSLHTGRKVREEVTTVGLVGYPNVGKSSTINALLTAKKTSVSATPGKTKHFQTLMLDSNFYLCDCPGLVFPNFVSTKAEMIISGILPIDHMTDYTPPVNLLVSIIPAHVFHLMYGILLPVHSVVNGKHLTSQELLDAYSHMKGFMSKGGLPNNARSSRIILKDFVNGKLLYCHAPPNIMQNDYFSFTLPSNTVQLKDSETDIQVSEKDKELDESFFKKLNLQAHYKGNQLNRATNSELDLPKISSSKKHYNRNKKEKLKRIY